MQTFKYKKILVRIAMSFTIFLGLLVCEPTTLAKNIAISHIINESSNFHITNNYEFVEYGKKKYRCKICGKTFSAWLTVSGHLRGNHGKWLYHKYYEKL